MLALEDVHEILAIDVLGVIPESPDVLSASNSGEPVILASDSDAGQAYVDAVDRLLGQERPLRFLTKQKRGLLSRVFGG